MSGKEEKPSNAEESCGIARVLISLGGSCEDIAAALDVDLATFESWRTLYPEFAAALEVDGKQDGASPERALARRALGYSLPIETVVRKRNGATVRVKTVRHIPPDVTAAELWLSNHSPETEETSKEQSSIAFAQSFIDSCTGPSSEKSFVAQYRENLALRLAAVVGRLGGSDVELAEAIGVSPAILKRWKMLHPELIKALNEGRTSLRVAIEDALRRRAIGDRYDTEEVTITPRGKIVRTKRVKYLAPDVRAARILLRSRDPEPEETVTFQEFLDNLDDETLAAACDQLIEKYGDPRLRCPPCE